MPVVRSDANGTYVISGRYIFRPTGRDTSKHADGEEVTVELTGRDAPQLQLAQVGDEQWWHQNDDPRLLRRLKKSDPAGFADFVANILTLANNGGEAPIDPELQAMYREWHEFLITNF